MLAVLEVREQIAVRHELQDEVVVLRVPERGVQIDRVRVLDLGVNRDLPCDLHLEHFVNILRARRDAQPVTSAAAHATRPAVACTRRGAPMQGISAATRRQRTIAHPFPASVAMGAGARPDAGVGRSQLDGRACGPLLAFL